MFAVFIFLNIYFEIKKSKTSLDFLCKELAKFMFYSCNIIFNSLQNRPRMAGEGCSFQGLRPQESEQFKKQVKYENISFSFGYLRVFIQVQLCTIN